MIKKVLYLPIETIARELDANLLMAHEALRRGYAVVLGEKREVQRFAQHLGGGVYIYKHWESQFPFRFDDEHRRNFFYVGAHQEGVVFLNDRAFFLRRMMEQGRTKKLDVYFARGTEQGRLLESADPELKTIIEVVGTPSFDILRPRYRALFDERRHRIAQKWSPFILINTNFATGNRSKHETDDMLAEREKSSMKNLGRPMNKEEKALFFGTVSFKERLVEEYGDTVRYLSGRFPDVQFILRPHPSEDHSKWREALHGLPNVHVIYSGNVVAWILASEAVIHTGCTTGIEARSLGKPVLRYNPIAEKSPYESELPNKFGRYVATLTDLEKAIVDIRAGKRSELSDAERADLKPFMDSTDGELASVRELDIVERRGKIDTKPDYIEAVRSYRTLGRLATAHLKRLAYAILRHPNLTRFLLGSNQAELRAARLQKFPYLSRRDIHKALRTLETIDAMPPRKIKTVRLDINTFC